MTFVLDFISIIAFMICLQTLRQWQRSWAEFWDDRVSLSDQSLAQRLALFVLVPLGVLLHEIGHSIAIWQVGGLVSRFQWRFLWGYVIPQGNFSPLQSWWIALSGNLVSVLLVAIALALIPRMHKRIVAEVLFFFAVAQAVVSLVSYPLMSLFAGWGDWKTIYDFSLQPYATLTLVVHGVLLGALWRLYHSQQAIHWRLARDPAIVSDWQTCRRDLDQHPHAVAPRLALVDLLLQQKELLEAKRVLRGFSQDARKDPSVQLMRASLATASRAYRTAIRLCQPVLTVELPPAEQVRLDHILSLSYFGLGQLPLALSHANHGLNLEPDHFKLCWIRAAIHWRLKRFPDAHADWQSALAHAPTEDLRWQLQQWGQTMLRRQQVPAPQGPAPQKLTPWQLVLAGLGFLPVIGMPFGITALIWGLISRYRNGGKLILLGGMGVAMTVVPIGFLFLLMLLLPSMLSLVAQDSNRKESLSRGWREMARGGLSETAALIEAYKAQKGSYPATLKEMADSPNYPTVFDLTPLRDPTPASAPPPAPSGASGQRPFRQQRTFVYQRLADRSGYTLFSVGEDGRPHTADDVLTPASTALPGLRPSPRPGPHRP